MAETLADWVVAAISWAGYAGVLLLMAVESACVPLPSEVIMPFAGHLASTGRFNLWLAALAGALGCNVGSIPPYEIGRRGGRAAVRRYGRWVLLTDEDVDRAERSFERFGSAAVLVARLLPAVRSFIALPAGVAGMPRTRFHLCTFAGSFPWCLGLTWIGMALCDRWRTDPRLRSAFRHADAVVIAIVVAVVAWFLWTRLRRAAPGA